MSRLVLMTSPLLGSSLWAPVAATLRDRGWDVSVPVLSRFLRTPDDVVRGFLDGIPDQPDLVLVPHSNAGLYVAAVAAARSVRSVRAVVFADAGMPAGSPTTMTAPQSFRDFIGRLPVVDGLLPPWTQWWPREDLDTLFPDTLTRESVEADEPRLPPSYFDCVVPSPPGWDELRAAYLAFGDTYADERSVAAARGWPVETLPGGHLHLLVDPVGTADALVRLLGRTGVVS